MIDWILTSLADFIVSLYNAGGAGTRFILWFWVAFILLYVILGAYEKVNRFHPPRKLDRQNYYYSLHAFGAVSLCLEYSTLLGWWPDLSPFPPGSARGLEVLGFIFLTCGFSFVALGRIYLNGKWGPNIYTYDGPPPDLTTNGVYRWTRHPIYLGQSMMAIGTGLAANAPLIAAFGIILTAVNTRRAWREDRGLEAIYGAEWETYSKKVSFFLPLGSALSSK